MGCVVGRINIGVDMGDTTDINRLVHEAIVIDVPSSLMATGAAMGGNVLSQGITSAGIKDKKKAGRVQTAAALGSIAGGLGGAYGMNSMSSGDFAMHAGLGSLAGGLAIGAATRALQKKSQKKSPIRYASGRRASY